MSRVAIEASLVVILRLRQQLGLRLESTKGPVDFIVIDHAEEPSAN
jgi:uncharacterized protein (TIGR03435 family)